MGDSEPAGSDPQLRSGPSGPPGLSGPVGVVGLGQMGAAVARRLLSAGVEVVGFNRTPGRADALRNAGLVVMDSPAAVTRRASVTFSLVTDDQALRVVAGGDEGLCAGLGQRRTLVEMSTVSAAASRELHQEVTAAGGRMLDAPVLGSSTTVAAGRSSLIVGGDPETVEELRPLLELIAPKVTHVGPPGAGASMKIAANIQVGVQTLAFVESVLLAERNGVSRATAVAVLLGSAFASPMLSYRGPFVLDPPAPDDVLFSVKMMRKDLRLAIASGHEHALALPSTEIAEAVLDAAVRRGLGDQEVTAVLEVLENIASTAAMTAGASS